MESWELVVLTPEGTFSFIEQLPEWFTVQSHVHVRLFETDVYIQYVGSVIADG